MKATRITSLALLTLVLAALPPTLGRAGNKDQLNFGSDFFNSSPPCPVRDFPTFQSIAPVPRFFDFEQQDDAVFSCFVQVQNGNRGVAKAKGRYEADLIVFDHRTNTSRVAATQRGRFATGSDGSTVFDFDFPAELFADGFESGDVSAWSYTRTDFTNKKKADNARVQCAKGVSEE